jgi:hypothetical protein
MCKAFINSQQVEAFVVAKVWLTVVGGTEVIAAVVDAGTVVVVGG